jgi:NTP pyrophosphatase (non-canonical NTP hydrolase)
VRDKGGKINLKDKVELSKELGDVLWYLSAISDYLGLSLEDVAKGNLDKVFSRKDRGVSSGSGDNR